MCFELSYLLGKHRRLIKKSKIKSSDFGASVKLEESLNMSEINRKRLKELLAIPENNLCADCADPNPNYASITIGVFLCASCVQIHRKLGTHVSRTKSLTHDCWDQQSVSFMEENGNAYAKSLYERYLPPYYRKPLSNDNELVFCFLNSVWYTRFGVVRLICNSDASFTHLSLHHSRQIKGAQGAVDSIEIRAQGVHLYRYGE